MMMITSRRIVFQSILLSTSRLEEPKNAKKYLFKPYQLLDLDITKLGGGFSGKKFRNTFSLPTSLGIRVI